MKTKFLILILFATLSKAQILNIPDANFKLALVNSSWQVGLLQKTLMVAT
jgi:hypothetical protein